MKAPHFEADATALVVAALAASAPLLPPGVTLRQQFDAKSPVKARSADTRAILAALITNAGDAIAERQVGGGTITLATRDEGTDTLFEVTDDGPGVAPTVQPRLFTPFFTTKARDDRPGLSLSIALQAARDQGGDLTFESPPEGGTTFRLRLPQWRRPASEGER